MAYHIYHLSEKTTWMELFRTYYPDRYNSLHFLPKVENVVRTDRTTGEQYYNFTLVPASVYGRLPMNREGYAYLHFSCGEGDLMVNIPSSTIQSVLDGTQGLDWLRDVASYANMLSQDLNRHINQWCDDWSDDYDPIEDANASYVSALEEFISEKMG